MNHPSGPQPTSHIERLARAEHIAAAFRQKFNPLALALYGSLARGTDGPYSDIEMFCIVKGNNIDEPYEWTEGPWKAEVNVLSRDVIEAEAAEFEEYWPISHSAFANPKVLHDPQNLFLNIRKLALGHTDEEFNQLIADTIVGEIYETMGKIRNAAHENNLAALPMFGLDLARIAACLVALDNRHLYSTASQLFTESLSLPGRPAGYDQLCKTMTGPGPASPLEFSLAAEAFWQGLQPWAAERSIQYIYKLDDLFHD